jgi:hypothetical protein
MTTHMIYTPNHSARLAGFLYLILIPLGFFGVAYVPELLVVPGDMAQTVSNIMASEQMFRLSSVSALLMNIVSVLLVLVLYKLLSPVGKNMAIVMVVFLLLGAGIALLNEVNHFAALTLSGPDTIAIFTAEQSQYFVRLFLDMYEYGSYIAGIFWGLWLFPLGFLMFKSNYLPKILGILLIIAGVGYLIDSFVLFLAPHYGITIVDYTFIGEVTITLWLLIKGVNVEQWKKRALEFEGV